MGALGALAHGGAGMRTRLAHDPVIHKALALHHTTLQYTPHCTWTQHATHHLGAKYCWNIAMAVTLLCGGTAVQGDKKSSNQSLRGLRAELEEFCTDCDDGFVLYL